MTLFNVLLLFLFSNVDGKAPNIIWFLTDDQDQMLGASFPLTAGESTPMPKTKILMQDAGIMAENWYIHTPICSPSRSELLTGRYFHNIKQVGFEKPYCSGMHINYTTVNSNTFAKVLKNEADYTVGMFGKYLNVVPQQVPEGFDAWLANGGGDYIAPQFNTKNIKGIPDGHWKGTSMNYSTSVIGNVSVDWIREVGGKDKPFMAYIAPKAAHEPFNPAPWYADYWHPSWPDHEPRPINWNCSAESRKDHHGNIATQPMLSKQSAWVIKGVFRNRWRTLMSVDDLIADVIQTVEDMGLMDNTYFFFSSDHGFQLGQFNIPMDKRHVYEWNTKIHLLARGPGIAPGTTFSNPGTQVDIAPTFLGLAGLTPKKDSMDGHSIAPFLLSKELRKETPRSAREHLKSLGDAKEYEAKWRSKVFIEYYYCSENIKCVQNCTKGDYPMSDTACGDLISNTDCWTPLCQTDCYKTEDTANNYIAIREPEGANILYAEFQTGDLTIGDISFEKPDFVEYYDVGKDLWQMDNLAKKTDTAKLKALHTELHDWASCKGSTCP